MNLYIIRHAIAVEPGTPGYADDSQRPLTGQGREKMVRIARGLAALEVRFDLLISSPYARALETARILLKVMKMGQEQLVVSETLAPHGSPGQVIAEIDENYPGLESVAVVGHEPNLGALISRLAAGGETALSVNLKKGAVCHLSLEKPLRERRAALEWLLTPRQLAALGGRG